ncbi:MAG: hypothetical protein IGQ45_14760 [Cyanobacterium sp. T60_A2020_053]|nr:hypothetical protein [Cyanobacterium sp. T60_A2020_053]
MSNNFNFQVANLSLNLPDEWLEKLDKIALQKEQNIEELVTDIIGQYLTIDIEPLKIEEILQKNKAVEGRLKVLENKVLENKDQQIEKIVNRLSILEKLVASLQINRSLAPVQFSQDYDEIEDEPDEILTDFLL